ncbi:MAG: hypothetical protein V1900_00020 [Candidatus Aenigmatarchaeota archaeon]
MAILDIGEIIFREILKMNEYPGAPFTGNIINDLVMFLLVPSVFIIVIIYTLVGRITDNAKLDLLLSITFYLFIIFGGYYKMFAYLAGPYFLIMLIFMGLVMFFFGHFGLRRREEGGGGMPAAALATGTTEGELVMQFEKLARTYQDAKLERDRLRELSKTNPALDRELAVQSDTVNHIKRELNSLEMAVKRQRLGHGVEAQIKAMRNRYGL